MFYELLKHLHYLPHHDLIEHFHLLTVDDFLLYYSLKQPICRPIFEQKIKLTNIIQVINKIAPHSKSS